LSKTELAVSALQVEYPAPKNVVITIELTTNTMGVFCVSFALLFQIFLPTGAHLVVTRNSAYGSWSQFMNVDLTPGLADEKSTSGLCGNFDGDASNDGKKEPIPGVDYFERLTDTYARTHR